MIGWLDHSGSFTPPISCRGGRSCSSRSASRNCRNGSGSRRGAGRDRRCCFFRRCRSCRTSRVGDSRCLAVAHQRRRVSLIRQALSPAAKGASSANSFHAVAVMGGVGRAVASSDFVGGDAVAVMGGCEINLGGAKITQGSVDRRAGVLGRHRDPRPAGLDESRITSAQSSAASSTRPSTTSRAGAPRLIIRGSAIMGGVEVKHPKG